jgi:hypothetical protein
MAELGHCVDARVMARMTQLATDGVQQVSDMRCLIQAFLKNELFAGSTVPPETDAKYHPSNKAILNCIYRTRMCARLIYYSVVRDYITF